MCKFVKVWCVHIMVVPTDIVPTCTLQKHTHAVYTFLEIIRLRGYMSYLNQRVDRLMKSPPFMRSHTLSRDQWADRGHFFLIRVSPRPCN